MKLSNKVALVTGGLKGIGRATVMELAMQGADIALNYRASEKNKVLVVVLVIEFYVLCCVVFCFFGFLSFVLLFKALLNSIFIVSFREFLKILCLLSIFFISSDNDIYAST